MNFEQIHSTSPFFLALFVFVFMVYFSIAVEPFLYLSNKSNMHNDQELLPQMVQV